MNHTIVATIYSYIISRCFCRLSSELHRHFHSSSTPVLSMVVHLAFNKTSSGFGSFVSKTGQNTKDHRDSELKVEFHQLVGDGVADVLKVHGGALDQNTNGDHGIKRSAQLFSFFNKESGAVRQLERAWNRLNHNVFLLDAKLLHAGNGTFHQSIDNFRVPASMENADSQRGA
ncbi:hypothetical protein EJF18_60077 [Clavispora lusitaniae]|uniref:Uncharacterized protein n=1 Tax=Clavispora lusitaniae TaxID=36911 RepID=A0ACD0WPU0_CLALS|nr:hypothetical protein EJF14_60077 [Clavispora lusitaniae]QFZ35217.1 hypothetical protein EJF16_60077 [Clavispora lusitaniae]QFZ40911.1 hypothetical protein EJF15_60077 [Clavispora lusitaniae]QFZ46592.1 hypothetical protein EJF18_60077 [Clavispora lusitaniae]QFZ52257.1 hypothetical protein EJF17_60077 [Clavispora lusitaniae]